MGLAPLEALDQELSAKLVSARDLALDSGLLLQASGAEVILAEQAYVTSGSLVPWKQPAQRVLELGSSPPVAVSPWPRRSPPGTEQRSAR